MKRFLLLGLALLLAACGDDDGGGGGTDAGGGTDSAVETDSGGGGSNADLAVLIEAEDTITEGLDPGGDDCGECIADGWTVRFDRYIVALGDVTLNFSTDMTVEATNTDVFLYDLAQAPAAGETLWNFDNLSTGRWDIRYRQPLAAGATPNGNVDAADAQTMVDGGCSYLISGMVTKSDGRSCLPSTDMVPDGRDPDADGCYENTSIDFTFCVPADTLYGPCSAEDGPSGVAVTEGGSNASLTIHGDHLFFNGFPEGDEGGVTRLVQWFADCDLNLDGTVTEEELRSILLDDLAEIDDRYDLGGAPALPPLPGTTEPEPMDDGWAYLRAQTKTQGHFNGEGECPVDGVEE
ncbi:MAG: hypothetical protein AAGE52_39310 [Myxococcota bacterium]